MLFQKLRLDILGIELILKETYIMQEYYFNHRPKRRKNTFIS